MKWSTRTILNQFPCQNCPCGCKSAEQCWAACCCFTPAERFAWAKKKGVTPPSYAHRPTSKDTAADGRSNDSRVVSVNERTKLTCCPPQKASNAKRACRTIAKSKITATGQSEGYVAASTKSCGSCCEVPKADRVGARATNSPSRKIVLSMFALKCQGKSSVFTLLPWTILATIQKVALYEHEFGSAHQVAAMAPAAIYSKPDTPPPK